MLHKLIVYQYFNSHKNAQFTLTISVILNEVSNYQINCDFGTK